MQERVWDKFGFGVGVGTAHVSKVSGGQVPAGRRRAGSGRVRADPADGLVAQHPRAFRSRPRLIAPALGVLQPRGDAGLGGRGGRPLRDGLRAKADQPLAREDEAERGRARST
eukprot:CAMPEP_0179838836 /NCGR_PEP_ID=MMETSP0982-20121206/945_1 /TAXON_ID=483367 /ORGANISM="non described non described, Strain CCMP 2436" /LENGTH=112 /DNA_ID=CAMNT_0021722347 /DNA_START=264 /DNA_END=599 /DNA_ORIENTATION=+